MKLTEISFRLLTLPLLVILVGCVTVNDSTVKHMSTAKLCEFLSPKWITLPSERKAVRSEVSSRGASCSPGSPAPVRQKARKESAGTGFIVSEVGHILTNHHVVKGCRTVVASMTNMIVPIGITVQPKLDAPKTREERSNFEDRGLRVIGVDARSDLALLQSARPSSTVAAFRGGRGVRTGEDIVIAGFPLPGLLTSDLNVTKGIVSALAGLRDDRSRIQITAPVQPGNSGGPVHDNSGNIVGVVVSKLDAIKVAKVIGTLPENVNFAVSEGAARAFLDAHDVPYKTAPSNRPMSTVDIAAQAKRYTVRIECKI